MTATAKPTATICRHCGHATYRDRETGTWLHNDNQGSRKCYFGGGYEADSQ